MPELSTRQVKYGVLFNIILSVILILLSTYLWFGQISEGHLKLAINASRQIFEELVITRRWNANHGGVYVPVTDETKPNPYLDDPLRDVYTTGGMLLTKINPAFMTRSIAELNMEERHVRIHITSLKPIRPANAAEPWETKALESFESGTAEFVELDSTNSEPFLHYMAPLITEKSCLKCHAKQGYSVGDIRGGISVSFSYAPYLAEITLLKRNTVLTHIGIGLLILAIILLFGHQISVRTLRLKRAVEEIDRLEGLLPICMYCKKIRSEDSDPGDPKSWRQIESFITERSEAVFSHGMCPECHEKMFPEK